MKVKFYGDFSFSIATKKGDILINPSENQAKSFNPAFSIFSMEGTSDRFGGKPAINWPGEFEYEGITVKSLPTRENGLAQIFRAEDMNISFVGDLKKLISQEKLEPLVNTDILFLPKTAEGMSNKDLKKLVEEIDPRIVIMAGDETLFPEILKELGAENVEKVDEYVIEHKKMPVEHTQYVQLSKSDI